MSPPRKTWRSNGVVLSAILLSASTLLLPARAGPVGTLISRGVPAYGSGEIYPASQSNDASYWDQARCAHPCYVALDLSSVPAANRRRIVVAWYNVSNGFMHTLTGDPGYNLPSTYTIDANAAGGGALPAAKWVTLADVKDDHYSGRQFLLDFTGYNWVRFRVTEVDGSEGNEDAAFNLDVIDASAFGNDSWLFLGDSITANAMTQAARPNFMQQINATFPARYPTQIDGGVGGIRATVASGAMDMSGASPGHNYMADWLAAFSARYLTLNYGTNDVGEPVEDYYAAMSSLVEQVIAAGRTPIVPTIPWSCANDVTPYNVQIAALYAAYPQVVRGPDLYSFFGKNRSLISPDCIHPSHPSGESALRKLWAQWAGANIYASGASAPGSGSALGPARTP